MAEPGKKRVLVVDDATLVRMFYRERLEAAGFAVDEALNGLEALEKVLVDPPDLLVVDINMPQMDGLTFLKVLRRQEEPAASIPAMITSTETGPQDLEAARLAGANLYLPKPVKPGELEAFAALLAGVAP